MSQNSKDKIIYTITDEAPALATYSFLPIISRFTKSSDISIETQNISLANRILAKFSDFLEENQKVDNSLKILGELTQNADTNIIKLPNISASIPQLKEAISELQSKGFNIPNYKEKPSNKEEEEIKKRYDAIKGSAVNPVLREGNSDRRIPKSIKNYVKSFPHTMGEWSKNSKTKVATMSKGDFLSTEKSFTTEKKITVEIQHINENGDTTVLKDNIHLLSGEIFDSSVMSKETLTSFLEEQVSLAKNNDVLFSIHMKATMMKISDPIIFGYAVQIFFKDIINKYKEEIDNLNINFKNGIGDLIQKIKSSSEINDERKDEIINEFNDFIKKNNNIAMVNSDLGITNLHVPSDIIIDASMPAMIRNSGKMYDVNGDLKDTLAVIPDSSYADVYDETINFCKDNGAFDPTKMGSVSNIGLMAKKAQEYGSHDKTFETREDGIIKVVDSHSKDVLIEHKVSKGDIWRACQTKDESIKDWVKLAVSRSTITKTPIVFWLNKERSHDYQLIKKVDGYLQDYDTKNIEIHILPIKEATQFTLKTIKEGKDVISVTGNVLRDYLTDLFPILELGTSSKMLSIVPLIKGGGLFETGAGGSAPKHVQQFIAENYLRWDSLGEFLALSASLDHLSRVKKNDKAEILSKTLDDAISKFLLNNKSPKRKLGEIDNRGSHFYLALYWAEELSKQNENTDLKVEFSDLYKELLQNNDKIINELISVQGKEIDLKGYYYLDNKTVSNYMRPSSLLNGFL